MRKSLGGDVFTVSWTRAGRKEAPMTGMVGACCAAQPAKAPRPSARSSCVACRPPVPQNMLST